MSGCSFFKSGNCVIERYGTDLDRLNQDDRVGLMRTSEVKNNSLRWKSQSDFRAT